MMNPSASKGQTISNAQLQEIEGLRVIDGKAPRRRVSAVVNGTEIAFGDDGFVIDHDAVHIQLQEGLAALDDRVIVEGPHRVPPYRTQLSAGAPQAI